ncbi:hypothetical protein QVD17_32336 [Tagetes erecta]|uniref:Uncharacterized protein n=1 Tax=Tagetes erecta TaxID=13708 RepID=A0AAD8KBJ8_TARER|nr:hypothetical protein QVD17_32336 [Tagetes erecta]
MPSCYTFLLPPTRTEIDSLKNRLCTCITRDIYRAGPTGFAERVLREAAVKHDEIEGFNNKVKVHECD